MTKAKKGPRPKRITTPPKEVKQKVHRAICHTTCFWQDTMWDPGDIYEGPIPPNKHFSEDGTPPDMDPAIRLSGDDPRSTVEMRTTLRKRFGVESPEDATRKEVFEQLRKHELAQQGQGGIKAKS